MVKKVVLGFLAFIVLFFLYYGVTLLFGGETTTKKVTTAHKGSPKVKPWNGTLTRTYNTTFIRKGQSLILGNVVFSRMNSNRANIRFEFATPSTGKYPSWLKGSTFSSRSAANRVYPAKARAKISRGYMHISVRLKKIPIGSLGDTCGGEQNDTLALVIRNLGRTFALQVIPPPAPAGHCFGLPEAALEPTGPTGSTKKNR